MQLRRRHLVKKANHQNPPKTMRATVLQQAVNFKAYPSSE
jgi:hypothetical protein